MPGLRRLPFHIWLDRQAAMCCRSALVRAGGHYRNAAMLIGIDYSTLSRILKRDNALLDARAAAEGWQPAIPEVPVAPTTTPNPLHAPEVYARLGIEPRPVPKK
jgi:hypothetical protein